MIALLLQPTLAVSRNPIQQGECQPAYRREFLGSATRSFENTHSPSPHLPRDPSSRATTCHALLWVSANSPRIKAKIRASERPMRGFSLDRAELSPRSSKPTGSA